MLLYQGLLFSLPLRCWSSLSSLTFQLLCGCYNKNSIYISLCNKAERPLPLSSMLLVHLVRGFSTLFYLPMKCFIGSLGGDLIHPANINGIFSVIGRVGTKSTSSQALPLATRSSQFVPQVKKCKLNPDVETLVTRSILSWKRTISIPGVSRQTDLKHSGSKKTHRFSTQQMAWVC